MINHKQFKHIYLFRYQILIALVALITTIENEDTSIDHTSNSKKKTSVQILRLILVTSGLPRIFVFKKPKSILRATPRFIDTN